jgi:hypothetical protein
MLSSAFGEKNSFKITMPVFLKGSFYRPSASGISELDIKCRPPGLFLSTKPEWLELEQRGLPFSQVLCVILTHNLFIYLFSFAYYYCIGGTL